MSRSIIYSPTTAESTAVGHAVIRSSCCLAINQITHRQTEIGSPETNGFYERFHRKVKEEFFAVAFRRARSTRVSRSCQADPDTYLAFHNRNRAHQGYRTQGRTSYQAFLDGNEASGQRAA